MREIVLVVLESPYAAKTKAGVEANEEYARACMADCFARGEYPFASHLLYTQDGVLDDDVKEERDLGIAAGFAWAAQAKRRVVYLDRGLSRGMLAGIADARQKGQEISFRRLGVPGEVVPPEGV